MQSARNQYSRQAIEFLLLSFLACQSMAALPTPTNSNEAPPAPAATPNNVPATTSPTPPSSTTPAPSVPASSESDQKSQYPTGVTPINVGVLELVPSKAMVTLFRQAEYTCYKSVIRFKVKNTSAADVRVILFAGLEATDDFGNSLYHGAGNERKNIKGSGIPVEEIPADGFTKYVEAHKSSMPIISPKQFIEVQLVTLNENYWSCQVDKEGEIFKTLKPKTYNISGTIGILDAEGKPEPRGFSFSEVPLELRK